jgi:HEAT repeat protein
MVLPPQSAGLLPRLMLAVVCQAVAAAPVCAVDEVLDSVMYTDPEIPVARVVKVFPPRLTTLWLRALERPEKDLKRQAAATIALAHQRGMPGLETTVTPLLRTLDQPEQHPTVRLAAAHALITLDARQAAPSLFAHAQTDGIEMRNLVEPALARWNYEPVRPVWLERLKQPVPPGRAWLLAIQGLGWVREPKAVPRLRGLLLTPTTEPVLRLEAARALSLLQTTGLEKDAERLAAETATPGKVAQVAAASLLRKHRSDQAATILQRLAVEAEPAVATIALEGLLEDDPRRVLPLLPRLVASPDVAVRTQAVEAHRRCPVQEHIPLVAELLDDPHPQVRLGARKALLEVARQADQNEAVRREATRLLATERWRALEQATILLTILDHKLAAPRFVELLRFERPEVFVTAAWGLRKLAVSETLPEQLREIERRWQQSLKPDLNSPHELIDLQVAQLAQSLGRAKYGPAAPVLCRFVPKQRNIGQESRTAAIWALGLIHQHAPPASLVEELIDRASDESWADLEDMRVRRMSAIALGRMKAKEAVASVRKYYPRKLSVDLFLNACGWALHEITGEPIATSGTVEAVQTGWFLEPSD